MNEFRDRGLPSSLPAALAALPWGPPETFLGMPETEVSFGSASVVVLPVPYEATVSYMGGTRFGPRGLLHASGTDSPTDRSYLARRRKVSSSRVRRTLP